MVLVLVHKPGFMQNQVINCRNNGLYNAHNTIQLLLIFLLGLKSILLGSSLKLLTQNSTFPNKVFSRLPSLRPNCPKDLNNTKSLIEKFEA